MNTYIAIITGPKEYLKEGVKVEQLKITQEEIDENREEGESDKEVIDYIIEEYRNEWEQRWCKVQLLTPAQYRMFDPNFKV